MDQEPSATPPADPQLDLRNRLAKDLAEGKTIEITDADLRSPQVRAELPALLEELTREQRARTTVVPGYILLGEIGRGGQSTVHLARHERLNRRVALKLAPQVFAGDERVRKRMLQEARTMAQLSHPNIVTIHDIVVTDDAIAIAMEYCDGLTLANLIQAVQGPPRPDDMSVLTAALGSTPEQAARLGGSSVRFFVSTLMAIANAVQQVHDAGLLHLDIKPSNILIRRDGTPLLADFGLVRNVAIDARATRTVGFTPFYAAPEQLRNRPDLGPNTDVYALGATLYEALARQRPFDELDPTRLTELVERGQFARLSTKDAIAPDLANIVHKAMAPEPHLRYPTAAAFAADLKAFLDHRAVTARPLSRGERLRRWARNQPWQAAFASTLLLLVPTLLGGAIYLNSQMPTIEAAEREKLARQANALKLQAYRQFFSQTSESGAASRTLEQAMELDPTPLSLVCLLAMAHEDDDPNLQTLIATHASLIEPHHGLRLFAAKVNAGRLFFNDDEAAELRASTDPTAGYTLAIDRTMRAEDTQSPSSAEVALNALEEAAIFHPLDPLLIGLRAWFAARSKGGEPRFEALATAAQGRWADDPELMAWFAMAVAPFDAAAATKRVEQHLARFPAAATAHEMMAQLASRDDTPEGRQRTLAVVERARRDGVETPLLRLRELLARCDPASPESARATLAELPQQFATLRRRLPLLQATDPAAAAQLRDEVMQSPRPRWWDLVALHREAVARGDRKFARQAWQRSRDIHPERRSLDLAATENLMALKDHDNAAVAAEHVVLPAHGIQNAPIIAWLHLRSGRLTKLAEFAAQWQQTVPSEVGGEPSFYAGLAAARRGDAEAAAREFAAALAAPSPGDWPARALLEDAWLRVDPTGLARLRDPGLAAARIAALDRFDAAVLQKIAGPWSALVRAEVRFANGDKAAAIAAAEVGLRPRKGKDNYAPDNVARLLQEALARYRR